MIASRFGGRNGHLAAIRDRLHPRLARISIRELRSSPGASSPSSIAARSSPNMRSALPISTREERLTPRHRFRIASHSKSFTAAGIMKLRERASCGSTIPIGAICQGPASASRARRPSRSCSRTAPASPATAPTPDSSSIAGPISTRRSCWRICSMPPAIEPNTRFKYSNHGFGLLGLVIEAITGEPYSRLDQARDRRCRRPARDRARHAARQGRAVRARPHAQAAARPAPGHPRRQSRPRDGAGRAASSAPPPTPRASSRNSRRTRRRACSRSPAAAK